MDAARVEAYLERIGAPRPPRADLEALTALTAAHLRSVPFENLSIHLGEPIALEEDALLAKLVDRRRGGFCYELNGAFAALLRALGFEVELLAARVHGRAGLGPPFDHLALRVTLDEPWLVDVGFGSFVAAPVRLGAGTPQQDAGGTVTFVAVPGPSGYDDLDVVLDGAPQYRLDLRPRALDEFRATCWYQQTAPTSHFATSLVCSLVTADGRATLSDRALTLTRGDERRVVVLDSDAAVLDAYREHFGIVLHRLPAVPAAG